MMKAGGKQNLESRRVGQLKVNLVLSMLLAHYVEIASKILAPVVLIVIFSWTTGPKSKR
jgi:hypothetical protein